MAARTKRRARYTWLPTIGTDGQQEGGTDNASGREFALSVPQDGSSNVILSELTFDEPSEGDFLDSTFSKLNEIIGNEWYLKRIVGKLFAGINQNNPGAGEDTVGGALFAAGFFIARADDRNVAGTAKQPIGAASLAERIENYSPIGEENIREPWIWRRAWVLSNQVGTPNPNSFDQFPRNTAEYGSVMDGPHIDAKTSRRIGQDDRLWFAVAARTLPIGNVFDNIVQINGYLDFRILGALRKARNSGKF